MAAENAKIKEELKNANAWWSRDINELERRSHAQTTALGEIRRRMTSLEMENIHLRRASADPDEVISVFSNASAKDHHNAAYDHLLDHYKHELSVKDSRIKRLEASLKSAKDEANAALVKLETSSEKEQKMKVGLENKDTYQIFGYSSYFCYSKSVYFFRRLSGY